MIKKIHLILYFHCQLIYSILIGSINEAEMLRTLNCGLGMILIVDSKYEKEVLCATNGNVVGTVDDKMSGKL